MLKIKLWLARLIIGEHYEIIDKGELTFCKMHWANMSDLVRDINAKLTAHRCYCHKVAINPSDIENHKI